MATCEADRAGFCYAPLEKPLTVRPGSVYFVVSEESASVDADLVWWGRELGGGGVRIIPADGSDDQNRGPYAEGNLGPLRLTGSVAIVNGTARYQADTSAASCADEAPVTQCGGGSVLCTSCTSSDWMAPSCPKGWNFESVCCATYAAKCVGITPNNGFSAFGPVSVRIEMPVKADDEALMPRSRGSVAPENGLGRVPIRGVSSWCVQGKCGWDRCWESEYRSLADAMVSSGLRDANFSYLIIDDCWVAGRNKTTGELYPDPTRFPSGMAALADYVHTQGLKLGIYTDVTSNPCVHGQYEREHERVPGSLGHYQKDARTFARWKIDYVKADFCNGTRHGKNSSAKDPYFFSVDPKAAYTNFSRALLQAGREAGRAMYFIACFDRWITHKTPLTILYDPPWNWMHPIANAYRLSGDHHDDWPQLRAEIESNANAASHSVPGSFGDWDYLTTGGQGCVPPGPPLSGGGPPGGGPPGRRCANMSFAEYRTAFSIWVVGASPLVIDADIRNLSAFQKETILHDEVLALHHDRLGAGGSRVGCAEVVGGQLEQDSTCLAQVWVRPLASNKSLVALLNLGNEARVLRLPFALLGYAGVQKLLVRDVWNRTDLGAFSRSYSTAAPVEAHATLLLRVTVKHDDETVQPSFDAVVYEKGMHGFETFRIPGLVLAANVTKELPVF